MEAKETEKSKQSDGWSEMLSTLGTSGLPVPPVPEELRAELAALGRWHWGTRSDDPMKPMEMYMFQPSLLERLLGDGTRDHVDLCHAGHGANSYALTYGLVYRGLVLLTQVGWGGAYMDNSAQSARLAEVYRRCLNLIDLAERHQPAAGRHLVAVESELRGTALCGWAPVQRPVRHLDRVRYGTVMAHAEGLLREAV
jgi:hypothetical protein